MSTSSPPRAGSRAGSPGIPIRMRSSTGRRTARRSSSAATRTRSHATAVHGGFEWHLFTVPVEGGEPEELPLGWAARIAIDPVSGLWAFNRASVEFRTWKRYRGGTSPGIWVGDPNRKDFKEVTK